MKRNSAFDSGSVSSRLSLLVAILGLLFVGCSSESSGNSSSGETDVEVGGETPDIGEGGGDVEPDETDIDKPDTDTGEDPEGGDGEDTDDPQPCGEPIADFGEACEVNSDCLDGWCVPSPAGKVCTQDCIECCPTGWACEPVSNAGQDVTFICVSETANLCRPCSQDSDCQSVGVDNAFCISYGDDGSFCGSPCDESDDCPKDTICETITLPNGVTADQCVPETGECTCNENAVQQSAFTPCVASNEFGSCPAARICTEGGLSDCGPEPAEEICNNMDDDCDGETDNADSFDCENSNDFGTCIGTATCQNGVIICNAPEASPEICDGVDNNCDGDVDEGADCDDGNACTIGECVAGVGCVNSALDCDDGDACTVDSCDSLDGCENVPVDCDDGSFCTSDACNPGLGCIFTTIVCNDDDVCNGLETCSAAVGCQPGTAPVCNDGDVCTVDNCNPNSGCEYDTLACTDDDPCTEDLCNPLMGCSFPVKACDDGNACTTDSCDVGLDGCVFANVDCNDGNQCTIDSCDPITGCESVPVSCDDGNACTSDDCVPGQGCVLTNIGCSDGDPCNGTETCDSATGCQAGTPLTCDDGLTCTEDSCNSAFGGCVFSALDCDDGIACTNDVCDSAGGCQNIPIECSDGSICNGLETCDTTLGCIDDGIDLDCNDNDACTTDTCDDALGCVYTPTNCDDGSECTVDVCDSLTGCGTTPVDCSDGDPCNGDETCNPATGCQPGTPLVCDDGNACTDDLCDPATGCETATTDCNDDNECTTDSCDASTGCQAAPVSCDDGNECTTDSCDPATGCVFTASSCDDGDACNGAETCDPAGGCIAGTPLECDDGNQCTTDSCDAASGCVSTSSTGPCDDGNLCTTSDTCVANNCVGDPVVCNPDGDPCTEDACNPADGTCYAANPDGTACDDGDGCTWPDTCSLGVCEGSDFGPCGSDSPTPAGCIITGLAGDNFECPIMVANAQPGAAPPATAIQFRLDFDSSRVELEFFSDGEFCPTPGVCIGPYTLPDPFSALQSGHIMEVNPKPLSSWNGADGVGTGELLIVHLNAPNTPLTEGTAEGGMVMGDSTMMIANFTLLEDIGPEVEPAVVSYDSVSLADETAAALPFEILDLVIITSP